MMKVVRCSLLMSLFGNAGAARVNYKTASDSVSVLAKSGLGENATIRISFNATYEAEVGGVGNEVGRLAVNFPNGAAKITNLGFVTSQTSGWMPGSLMGKADEYVWPITPFGHDPSVHKFTFDHGVSDLVIGDVEAGKQEFYRPEFEEAIFNSGRTRDTPESALTRQLREEQKESRLQFGYWQRDGYFKKRVGYGGLMQYTPRLKLKDQSFQPMDSASSYVMASLQRPHILDIDNLFSMKPTVPSVIRPSSVVDTDPTYHGGASKGQCYPASELQSMIGRYCGRNAQERCATQQECQTLGGRFKPQYCTGGRSCGCCKEIGQHKKAVAPSASQPLPVQLNVEWLTPVLQKFRCVSVAPQYAKTGASSMFIAMGWDTESGVSELDLDLSLVPVGKTKKVIQTKVVYYGQKAPRALSSGRNAYAMQAFNDDRSGDEPGDDELVKVNLGLLNQYHQDVEAVVVLVNIFAPSSLTWNKLDSAYMRIISGGREMASGGNFFIHDAEAVRTFVRLSGNDLKSDRDLTTNGLAVGMFFREADGSWAFSAIMKGVKGRNVEQSRKPLEQMLADLVYPANAHWDQTRDQEDRNKKGAFGEAGIHGGARDMKSLIAGGQLPCVASRSDQANLMLGHMTGDALRQVNQNTNLPKDVRQTAGEMMKNNEFAKELQGRAQAVDRMEKANTEEKRKEIAKEINTLQPSTPTEKESNEAVDDLEGLFDAI